MTSHDPQLSRTSSKHSLRNSTRQPNHLYLRPEDAFYAHSPPRKPTALSSSRDDTTNGTPLLGARQRREKRRGRSSSRRRRSEKDSTNNNGGGVKAHTWQKLLWVKQSFPDNYTDEETFLDHLQRNPRLRPYEFWPLVADSTIIVQHVCSVVIFVCCFTAIFQERVRPQMVVGWATAGTVAGWVCRDYWSSLGEGGEEEGLEREEGVVEDGTGSVVETAEFGMPFSEQRSSLVGTETPTSRGLGVATPAHSRVSSTNSTGSQTTSSRKPATMVTATHYDTTTTSPQTDSPALPTSTLSPQTRTSSLLSTAKSALLIYSSLLGLSPILKSLTRSTSEDSIWALSSWLMILNVFTFDYGAGPSAKFPASLSTNAAVMASTVLASRLPSTTHVFSLTLFSIEVFGLFPVFRRHLRHRSWRGHLALTVFLVVLASGGLGMVVSGSGWVMGVVGVVLGGTVVWGAMGVTSWWLIGLQRYKNEIHGPWDPARPVIRRAWSS